MKYTKTNVELTFSGLKQNGSGCPGPSPELGDWENKEIHRGRPNATEVMIPVYERLFPPRIV